MQSHLQVDRDAIRIKGRTIHETSQSIIQSIQSVIPELNGDNVSSDQYYRQIYKPYLKKTTALIGDQATVYKWNASTLSFSPSPLFPKSEDARARSQDWNISIICFGKSITYMLKYVAYLFYDLKMHDLEIYGSEIHNTRQLHVSFLCDGDTANGYLAQVPEQTDVLREPVDMRFGFHRYMGLLKDQGIEDPTYYPLDASELELLSRIHIYMVRSDHILCKGVGAKRAMTQYLHAKFASSLDDPNSFLCMTIDDNITGLYEMNNRTCHNRTSNKDMNPDCTFISCLTVYDKLKAQMDSRPTFLISGVSKGNGPGATADHTVEDKDSYSIYKLIMTRSAFLWDRDLVYNPFFTRFMEDTMFNTEVGSFQNKRMIGHSHITKGKGRGPGKKTQKKTPHSSARSGIIKNTGISTTKTTETKTTEIKTKTEKGVSDESKPSAFKMGNIRLTFGHIKKSAAEEARLAKLDSVCIGNIRDYDEYLPSYLAEKSMRVDGIQPIYAMYYLFLYAVLHAGHMRARIKTGMAISFFIFNPTTEGITLPLESKYGFLTFPLNLFLIAYTWNREVAWSNGGTESIYDHIHRELKNASYEKHLLVRWINNRFLQREPAQPRKKVAPLTFEFNESMTTALEIGRDSVYELEYIHHQPFARDTFEVMQELQTIRQAQIGNVCKHIRAYMKSKVDVSTIVWMDSASASASAPSNSKSSITTRTASKIKIKPRMTRSNKGKGRA